MQQPTARCRSATLPPRGSRGAQCAAWASSGSPVPSVIGVDFALYSHCVYLTVPNGHLFITAANCLLLGQIRSVIDAEPTTCNISAFHSSMCSSITLLSRDATVARTPLEALGRQRLRMHAAPCPQGGAAVDLSGAAQSIGSMLQAVGQAVQPTLQAGERGAAPAEASAKLEAIQATQELVRDIGVDSNLPDSATPASEAGAACTLMGAQQ